jgi:hypothetical protein
MSSVIVSPIARPAIEAKVPRASAAVAKMTQTRKNVRTASITRPAPAPTPFPSAGTPSLLGSVSSSGRTSVRRRAPSTPPRAWAAQ